MRLLLTAFSALFALLLGFDGLRAQLPTRGENWIRAELIAENRAPAPGETVTLALVMMPKPGWHGYWKNPGDAGTEMRTEWSLPPGATIGPFRYPMPQQLTISGLMNYVYEGQYALLAELKLPRGLTPGRRLPISAHLDYLACTDRVCVPEKASVALELTVGASGGKAEGDARFDRYRAALPKPLASEARFEIEGRRLKMLVALPQNYALRDPYFFPATSGALAYAAVQAFARQGDRLWIEVDAPNPPAALETIEGVLRTGDGHGLEIVAVRGDVPPMPRPPAGGSGGGEASGILAAFLAALLGGLILNIMPCVFPIISLKALSLVKSGSDETRARREGLAYAAGAILVCLLLGAVLLLLRAGGEYAGWAFQLQDPRVILFLLLLVTAISLNLAGLFELPAIGLGERAASAGGAGGAFWTGALAGFVATPCTGPFMGAAMGAALVLPAAAGLAVFGGLGLGLALPFLLLAFVPPLRRHLPKPGVWMGTFRRILSVPMFLTAFGLAWVLGRQTGVDGMALGLAAAMVTGLLLWWFARSRRIWLPLILGTASAAAAFLLLPVSTEPITAGAKAGLLNAEPFSEARLRELRAEGRPVFVYFTADWCLTCKVNEQAALETRAVAAAFAAGNVAVLKGDWTRGDPEIGRFLARHNRSGVPLYLFYAPGRPPEVLPQILTEGRLAALAA